MAPLALQPRVAYVKLQLNIMGCNMSSIQPKLCYCGDELPCTGWCENKTWDELIALGHFCLEGGGLVSEKYMAQFDMKPGKCDD